MARVFMDGFETGRPAGNGTTVTGSWNGSMWQFYMSSAHSAHKIGVTTTKKTGTYGLHWNHSTTTAANNSVRRNLEQNLLEHYGRAEMYFTNITGTHRFLFVFDESAANVAAIGFSQTGDFINVHLFVGTNEVASLSEAFVRNTWTRIEWYLLVDDTNGEFEVKINGNSLVNFAGDTKGSSSGNGVRWLGIGRNYSSTNDATFYVDDVAINDTTGTVNNSWVGRGYIYLAKPKGIGNYSQWTPSNITYDNYEMVNTIPDDGDATYVESETPGHRDSYQMETIEDVLGAAIGDGVIKAVQHVFKGRYEDAHAAVEPFVRIGAVDYDLDPATDMLNAYFRHWDRVLNVNPATSAAWTVEAFDGMEAGVKFDDS